MQNFEKYGHSQRWICAQEIAEAAEAMKRAVELTRVAAASMAATVDDLRALQVGLRALPKGMNFSIYCPPVTASYR